MSDDKRSASSHPKRVMRARRLRRDATVPERMLWEQLRDRRLAGLKFRRQQPIGPFTVDFYCAEQKLVIELDGQSHDGQREYDLRRQQFLMDEGLRVVRFDNEDVLHDMGTVLKAILRAADRDMVTGLPTQAPHPGPLPRRERE